MVDQLINKWLDAGEESRRFRRLFMNPQNASQYIPTWENGLDQRPNFDPANYAAEGYQKNSLIYSCVTEIASSFAGLIPTVERPRTGVFKGHKMVRLLRNPNSYQTGRTFAELAMTHYEVAGNTFIEMVPRSPNPRRARMFATSQVQDLHLIRPDYVVIEPGLTRDTDIFRVEIGGEVKRRIPRERMIHIAEPNLTNDFYGLSKIAVLVNEGNIDQEMSSFELAFFRNAGVPMGMLKVKGRLTEDDTAQIKSRFRNAYNGVKKWFEVMVVNKDQAEYEQMGLAPSDMEQDSTRFHAESRICSVFGIPPIIVGARVALAGGAATAVYEDAQHAFWSETMVPTALRFAAAWETHLLPLLGSAADEEAEVGYDFSGVRALQEDRSRKHREVVRMVQTGAFTVNQALELNGEEPIPGGDFYVRQGGVVIVDDQGNITRMSDDPEQEPAPDEILEGSGRLERLFNHRKEIEFSTNGHHN